MDDSPRQLVVSEDQHESTLAALVRELMDGLSWNRSRDLVRNGRVKVGGALHFDPAERVSAGTLIQVNPTAQRRQSPVLERERLIHVDRDVVVVRKPAGLLSVPYTDRDDRDTLIERTRQALRERGVNDDADKSDKRDLLGVVQRLDKDTTGLLVFARTRAGRKGLEAQFRAHTVERRYVALVHGRAEAAVHDSFLVPDRGDGLRGSWRGRSPPKIAKRAITKVRVESRLHGPFGEITLVSCRLETGRQHQIRIHLAEAGHPLVGEQVYGRGRPRAQTGDQASGPKPKRAPKIEALRPMLHAASLGFRHPVNERMLRFEDPLPDDFRALLDSLS
ncbi:Ribosomal large subunit pseudouridine synthase D [Enhygromyxa salina]|uniref:Ribosomal large subunit pseudouridine synthase D n=1 Tax=Enhygromyxa salina TaxID=215803 RepID=A0A0C1ZAR2_9BACT|nr:pseudouridine synthase [Enhygromyxa salina]KIG14709.1 Ribosomal large subunit pseudouridine synthase D [Enhygromyxa salina]